MKKSSSHVQAAKFVRDKNNNQPAVTVSHSDSVAVEHHLKTNNHNNNRSHHNHHRNAGVSNLNQSFNSSTSISATSPAKASPKVTIARSSSKSRLLDLPRKGSSNLKSLAKTTTTSKKTTSNCGSRSSAFVWRALVGSVNLILFVLTIATIVAILLSAISNQLATKTTTTAATATTSSTSSIVVRQHRQQNFGQDFESLPLLANVNVQAATAVAVGTPGVFGNASSEVIRQPLDADEHRRVKRGVIFLGSMIKCITGCNPFSYKDYGCFCGFQGDGIPMDGIDSCCQQHDLCYERAECHQKLVYFTPYKWSCSGSARGMCSEYNSPCAYQLCQCDRIFAKCLKKFPCPADKAECVFPPPRLLFNKSPYSRMSTGYRSGRRRYG